MTAPVVEPADVDTDDGPDILHIVCVCVDPPVTALCGTDITGDAYYQHGDHVQPCRVCADLAFIGCPQCGLKRERP